ncbi:MAG TPA: hypothetical protein VHD33_00060 [Legionellaceae bacterium]|nr:hypothetical protein [Legionellaceae bacterium]
MVKHSISMGMFILFLGYSGSVLAENSCKQNFLFDVVIINKTGQDCNLLDSSIDNGQIHSKHYVTQLRPEMQSQRYRFCDPYNTYKHTLVTMNLQCGVDKFVTLQIQRNLDIGILTYMEHLEGITTNLSNMNASSRTELAKHSEPNKPSTIYWTLE